MKKNFEYKKQQGLMKYPQKYGWPRNSTTYCSNTVIPYKTKTIDRWTKGCILPFPKKGDLGIAKNYRGITLSSQDLQCSTTQLHRTKNWEDTLEEPKWLSAKSINDITNLDYLSNSRCTCKKPWRNNTICRLLRDLWLHTQREDGANTTYLRTTQRNHHSHNDAI